jgi:hypothetical protein
MWVGSEGSKSKICHGFWNLRHLIIMRAFGFIEFPRLGMLLNEKSVFRISFWPCSLHFMNSQMVF